MLENLKKENRGIVTMMNFYCDSSRKFELLKKKLEENIKKMKEIKEEN